MSMLKYMYLARAYANNITIFIIMTNMPGNWMKNEPNEKKKRTSQKKKLATMWFTNKTGLSIKTKAQKC